MRAVVSFEIEAESESSWSVMPTVDGVALAVLVEAFERAQEYRPAGGHGGLVPTSFDYGRLDDYFAARTLPQYWLDLSGVYLLGCQCGEVGCWPLVASIHRHEDAFRWDGFRQPHRRDRDYRGFGPFVFSRTQYEDALRDMLRRVDALTAATQA